jgi:acyl carrier protein
MVGQVFEMVRKQLGGKLPANVTIGPMSNLDELGLSSLQVSDIIFTIEEALGIEFDVAEAAEVSTIAELVELANTTKKSTL